MNSFKYDKILYAIKDTKNSVTQEGIGMKPARTTKCVADWRKFDLRNLTPEVPQQGLVDGLVSSSVQLQQQDREREAVAATDRQ